MKPDTATTGSTRTISPDQFNILFTCVGRRVALLNAFRSALAELGLDGKIIATDITTASSAFHIADEGILVPSVGRVEYTPALLDIVRNHDVKLLVPLTDLDLRSLARQRGKFQDLGCTVMIASEAAVTLCRNKAQTNLILAESGLATIDTFTLQEFLAKPFYPCFVKPIRGSASIGAGMLRDEKELWAHVATYGDLMLLQEYVPGREYTIDVYRSRDGWVRCIVPRQRLTVRAGEVEKGVTVMSKKLMDCTSRLVGCLGDLWGVFCCQCRWPDDGPPRFFEINPRFGGGAPLSIHAGANLPLYLLQEVLGLPITAELGGFTPGTLMLRYDEAIFTHVDCIEDLPGYDSPQFR